MSEKPTIDDVSKVQAALLTLQGKGYTYHGGQLWKPPIGQKPDFDLLDAAQTTIAQQAQMIEHLRGGLTTPTTVDVANADADGFKNGRKSVGLLLGKGFNTLNQVGGKYSISLAFQSADDAYAAYTEIAKVVRLAGEA